MPIRVQITPDSFKRAMLVKPGWYPTLIKSVSEELNSKKDAMNVVLDCENADDESEFHGVPCKHWLSEKGHAYAGGMASFARAFNPSLKTNEVFAWDDVSVVEGRYIYAKWNQNRGREGTDPPRNVIEDWAPLPKKWAKLADVKVDISSSVEGFETT